MADSGEYGEARMIEMQAEARQRASKLLAHVVEESHVSPAVLAALLDAEIARHSLAKLDAEASEGLYNSNAGAERLALRRKAVQDSLDEAEHRAERIDSGHRTRFLTEANRPQTPRQNP